MANQTYAQDQGLRLLQAIITKYGPIFTFDQARLVAENESISLSRTRQLISLLAKSGWIARLKRGLYLIQSPLFTEDIHPFVIATMLVQPSAISHWSALMYHGLTTQIPPMIQVSTPKKVVTPEMRHGGSYRPRGRAVWKVLDLEIEYIIMQERRYFGFQEDWLSRWHRIKIMDLERTSLDLVASSAVFGGIQFALEIFGRSSKQLNVKKIVDYALRYNSGAVIKRLGWILEQSGVSRDLLKPLINFPVKNYYLIEPKFPREGPKIKDWKLIDNLPRE